MTSALPVKPLRTQHQGNKRAVGLEQQELWAVSKNVDDPLMQSTGFGIVTSFCRELSAGRTQSRHFSSAGCCTHPACIPSGLHDSSPSLAASCCPRRSRGPVLASTPNAWAGTGACPYSCGLLFMGCERGFTRRHGGRGGEGAEPNAWGPTPCPLST